jgi:alanyl-tRNA synthetase
VDPDKTRFDFAHDAPVTDAEIARIERLVNAEILANVATQARVMPIADAQKTGAMMLFGEKYGDDVRVLDIGTSRELCGGTHVARTGDIGPFKIVSEGGVAAGVRRVEAVTGLGALDYMQARDAMLTKAAGMFKAPVGELEAKITQLLEHARVTERELARLKTKAASSAGDDLAGGAVDVKGAKGAGCRARRRRREGIARNDGQAEGQTEERGDRAGQRGRRQGHADRGRDQRPHRQSEGGRTRQSRRPAGRRQGRRAPGHGAGRRHRSGWTPCLR